MQRRVKVEIRLFGALRKWDGGAPCVLELPRGAGIAEIRGALREELTRRDPEFDRQELLGRSALADEREILSGCYRLERDTELAILPPVCGG